MNSASFSPSSVLKLDAENNFATVCAWCPSKKEGDAYAENAGFTVSHGICPTCHKVFFGEAPPRLSCAVSSATAGRDRHISDKQIAVAEVAAIVGLADEEIVRHFVALCFRPGYDFEQLPSGMVLRRAVLPELVGELAVAGRTGAAARLMQWLTTAGGSVPAEKVYGAPLAARPARSPWYAKGVMA